MVVIASCRVLHTCDLAAGQWRIELTCNIAAVGGIVVHEQCFWSKGHKVRVNGILPTKMKDGIHRVIVQCLLKESTVANQDVGVDPNDPIHDLFLYGAVSIL